MSGWTIRIARESDLDRLVELRLALQDHIESCNPHIWRLSSEGRKRIREQLAALLAEPETRVVVATNEADAIVAMAVGRIHRRDDYVPRCTASIEMVFVEAPHRRQGVGTRLVAALCEFFASHNVEDISLRYIVGNREAERFWQNLGFQPRIITAGVRRDEVEKKLRLATH